MARITLATFMIAIGVTHFASPEGFVQIVPKVLPAPLVLVYVSGVFEVLGGIGVLVARTRRMAGWGLIALYVAVFPANINMAVNHIEPAGTHIPEALFWLRLPLQVLLIAFAWWCTRDDAANAANASGAMPRDSEVKVRTPR